MPLPPLTVVLLCHLMLHIFIASQGKAENARSRPRM